MRDHALSLAQTNARRAFGMHARTWQQNRYVYPVVSRRSKGISIGINLNPDKACNFDCVYCSVDRTHGPEKRPAREIELSTLNAELLEMLDLARSGKIYQFDPFDRIPVELRRINDIAFSGDGEPTSCPQFAEAVRLAASVAEGTGGLGGVKLVLITNATMFDREPVRRVLEFLDGHHGEIWAKLDAGSERYYQLVDRTAFPFARVLENIAWCCQKRPTVIQSLLMKVHEAPPADAEIDAYAGRLADIVQSGGRIKLVQIYTVARAPAESYATPLMESELQRIADSVRMRVPGLCLDIYP